MGWFDEQIHDRKRSDNEIFSESFEQMAGAVTGKHSSGDNDEGRKVSANAFEEILEYFHMTPVSVPADITDMNEIIEYQMRPLGIMHRRVKLEKGWHRDAQGAMLGTLKADGSMVALIPDKFSGYRYYEHVSGRFVKISRHIEDKFEAEAIVFYKPFPLGRIGTLSLVRYICEQISITDIVMLCFVMLLSTIAGLTIPYMNKELFSTVIDSGSERVLVAAVTFILAATISRFLLSAAQNLVNIRINTKLGVNVEAAAMMRMLSLPASFFKKYNSGELANRMGYINNLCTDMVTMTVSAALTSLFSLLYIIQIVLFAPGLVIPAFTMTLLTLIVTVASIFLQMRITGRQMLLGSKENGLSYSIISGIQKIKLSGSEKRAFGRWAKTYADQAALLYNPPTYLKVSGVICLGLSLIGGIVMYYAALVTGVSVSEYYAFNSSYGMVSAAFMSLTGIIAIVSRIKPIIDMARPILEAEPEISDDKEIITSLGGKVELNNITFSYRSDMPPVIDGLTLKIEPGQYVAIVGETGCGKSTLMRLMLGFETPQRGAVYYDGKDLRQIDLKSLRKKIGSVMQNGKLFPGDIYSNIVLTAPWLSVDDAWKAAEIAGIAEDIGSMPMGMFTMISEGQGGVSGGQKQRLLIARAIAPKPRILIFDEATSALDNITQKQISDALDGMKCTRIVIAHRLSTIKQCDRIILIKDGKIAEDGTYEELMAQKSDFADLVSRQLLENEVGA